MTLLELETVASGYGGVAVLHDVSAVLEEGQLLAVVGPNGAGKSTLMRTIAGLNRVHAGAVRLAGVDISRATPIEVARLGVAHVPENRRVFAEHRVDENLRLGGYACPMKRSQQRSVMNQMFEKFPILRERRAAPAGTLSGGEQQMLAIAMALMAQPRVLMLDEPSLGLAPMVVRMIFGELKKLREAGTTILLNEQMVTHALAIADQGLVLNLGRVVAQGPANELMADDDLKRRYLGG